MRKPTQQTRIAIGPNTRTIDLRGLPKESVEEYLRRGGEIRRIPWSEREMPTLRAIPRREYTLGIQLDRG